MCLTQHVRVCTARPPTIGTQRRHCTPHCRSASPSQPGMALVHWPLTDQDNWPVLLCERVSFGRNSALHWYHMLHHFLDILLWLKMCMIIHYYQKFAPRLFNSSVHYINKIVILSITNATEMNQKTRIPFHTVEVQNWCSLPTSTNLILRNTAAFIKPLFRIDLLFIDCINSKNKYF